MFSALRLSLTIASKSHTVFQREHIHKFYFFLIFILYCVLIIYFILLWATSILFSQQHTRQQEIMSESLCIQRSTHLTAPTLQKTPGREMLRQEQKWEVSTTNYQGFLVFKRMLRHCLFLGTLCSTWMHAPKMAAHAYLWNFKKKGSAQGFLYQPICQPPHSLFFYWLSNTCPCLELAWASFRRDLCVTHHHVMCSALSQEALNI